MATGNYLVDIGIQEQTATPTTGEAPYFMDINNLTKPTIDTSTAPEYEKWGLQNQEEMDLMKYVKETGGSSDDFTFVLEDYRKKTQPDFTQSLAQKGKEDAGGLTNFKEGTEDILGGAISSVPSIIGNTFGFLADIITPKEFEGLGEHFRQRGVKDKEGLQKILGVDPESFATDVGEFGAEVGSLFIPGGQATLIARFPQATEKITKLGKVIEDIGAKAPETFNVLKNTLTGAKEMGKFGVVSEGAVTGTDLVIGAVSNPLLSLIGKGAKGIINKFGGAREVDQVAGNILQPTGKFGSLNFESAKQGLLNVITKLGGKDIKTIKDYNTLSKKINSEKTEVFKPLTEGLNKISKTYKDTSVTEALDGLLGVLKVQPSKKFKTLTSEIESLSEKSLSQGLTLSEIQKVKQLHTENNRLFTDTGKETGGVSSEALREVRKDIKVLIESKAEVEGFKDVARINTEYSNLLDASNLIQVQLGRLTNFLGREGKQSFIQNITEFALNLPGIKQGLAQPIETAFKTMGLGLKAGKIDPIRVEQQLPSLLKELRASNIPEKEIGAIMQNLVNTLKLLTGIGVKEILEINK